ncbi:hypothetical protein O0I10_012939 [Lichtheimia ornata]|uniref:Uncharacterized protein n=1 Tax=Lichtheimia ornata TaxID=688661 RepID=A0AAD7XSM8_9FUNG|nr:uncharacterized protein O0I10_012939 [Lichtheimia ornata]KAJ8651503.1 hypothetical protein O0I10_012939 [Lichtheimia ornata]
MSNPIPSVDMGQQLQQLQQLQLDGPTRAAISILTSSLQAMQHDVSTIKQLQEQYNEVVEQNKALAEKNSSLEAEVTRLRQALEKAKTPATTMNPTATKPPTLSVPPSTGTAASTWASLTAKHTPIMKPRTVRKIAAAARLFSQPDPNAVKGFEYVYIPRSRRLTYREARAKLRTLGIDTYRILDITFPARSTIGLLIHAQYHDELIHTLAQAKIRPIKDFDPTDPAHIADPKHEQLNVEARTTLAMNLHRQRCTRALLRMPYYLAVNVGKAFVADGIMDQDTLEDTLKDCDGAPVPQDDDDRDKPTSSSSSAMEEDERELLDSYIGANKGL